MFQVGDFVKGKENNGYAITNEKMLKGLVVGVKGEQIKVKVLEHVDGSKVGVFTVRAEGFESIGHVKPFDRKEAIQRLEDGNPTALLAYDLTGADLTGADLTRADLTRADLTRADLTRANLTRADLNDANLTDAKLTDADLTGANLNDANMTGADLTRANLTGANMTGANLTGANMTGARLTGANLTRANIDYASWQLWCGSIGVKVDKRIACQLAYHLCAVVCDDPEYIRARNSILDFANQFHRVKECGVLKPIKIKGETENECDTTEVEK